MLGPALELLLRKLHARRENLTPFERRLHQELYALKSEEGFPRLPGTVGSRDFAQRPGARQVASPSKHGPANLVVGVGNDDEAHLQINCERTDCPNKELGR